MNAVAAGFEVKAAATAFRPGRLDKPAGLTREPYPLTVFSTRDPNALCYTHILELPGVIRIDILFE